MVPGTAHMIIANHISSLTVRISKLSLFTRFKTMAKGREGKDVKE